MANRLPKQKQIYTVRRYYIETVWTQKHSFDFLRYAVLGTSESFTNLKEKVKNKLLIAEDLRENLGCTTDQQKTKNGEHIGYFIVLEKVQNSVYSKNVPMFIFNYAALNWSRLNCDFAAFVELLSSKLKFTLPEVKQSV